MAGDARHVGIGSDFDGGQGAETAPAEIDTVADLPVIAEALHERGYPNEAIENIMGGNWKRVLSEHLPRQE
jgi:membrane dipeptidase